MTCTRCGKAQDPPPVPRVPFPASVRERILAAICGDCWAEWERMEVRVVNEYRLNFLEPSHREMLRRACFDFLGLTEGA
jgi:Fe-S cluster biosynthesis and repair protein YggX